MEELPAQPVLRRGSPRLGLGGTFAVAAIVALLAAGFGVLGGRPDAEPVPTSVAVAPSAGVTGAPIEAGATPRVTPWVACGEPPTTAPRVLLESNGRLIAGAVEVVESSIDVSPPPSGGPPSPSQPADRIEVPIDVINELWVAGSPCAVAWTIDLVDHQNLESVPNTTHDLAYAAQNRFQLFLAPNAGDFELRAVLVFPTLVAHATWPIRIPPIERHAAVLYTEGPDIRPVEGCDVTITLATGVSRPLHTCVDDVGEPPDDAPPVRPGERLSFGIPGWRTEAALVICGRLSGQSFIAQPRPACEATADPPSPLAFVAPSEPGRYTLALSACGSIAASAFPGRNQICGTWYANIVVEA